MANTSLLHLFRKPALSPARTEDLLQRVRERVSDSFNRLETEFCYNIAVHGALSEEEQHALGWLLSETFEQAQFGDTPFLSDTEAVIEVGPRMNFSTAWSTNAVSICRSCSLEKVIRVERSRRYLFGKKGRLTEKQVEQILPLLHDRMTECHYPERLNTFETGVKPEGWFEVPVMEKGRQALEEINAAMGLAFDEWDLDYYTNLFKNDIKRNPTNVECFDIGQSNSEHSRHWFFKGRIVIDGEEMPDHLIKLIQAPLEKCNPNSLIAFKDNSSVIRGYPIRTILPGRIGEPSAFTETEREYHILFTAETHNFPSGVAPFPGAETGTGGRLRDVHATGRGSLVVAGTAAYCVGNLQLPGYPLPWEDADFAYPANLAAPLEIEIQASNGASDYGNKFGEPLIQGYTRSFGMRLANGERREWIKPIMFTGGIGQIDETHVEKEPVRVDMLVVKIGGPAYRIGMGGGAASSMMQGENAAELDFNAVQRGDAEMEQKVNRVIRACVELGPDNPIVSIHDQGAGGNCNVVKEIIEPEGGDINIRAIQLGDETLSVLEIWGAEYQEQDALLIRPEHRELFSTICRREKIPAAFIGTITGSGRIVLHDPQDDSTPVDLELKKILGSMPQKTFKFTRSAPELKPLKLPPKLTAAKALDRVLRLVSVGSKRFLTNKVDRSVTGLIARQQCAGPLQLTVSDVAVIAQSHFGITGAAMSIGEQPVKSMIDAGAMARLSVGEALTNLVWARVSALEDIKCSCNWMWAAKLPGEGAELYDAAVAMSDLMQSVGIAVDGGKDSVSMAAQVTDGRGETETVKAPGAMVISAYVTSPDITKTVTPDLAHPGASRLILIDLGQGKDRLGGSALAHVYGQIGSQSPDVDDPELLKNVFNAVQALLEERRIAAGHDRSDGGLIVTALEMAFAGNCGLELELDTAEEDQLAALFAEELGLVIEIPESEVDDVLARLWEAEVPARVIGRSLAEDQVRITSQGRTILESPMTSLRDVWEATSFELDKLQTDPACTAQEQKSLKKRAGMQFTVSYVPKPTSPEILSAPSKIPMAIIREEGSNGDREMTSAFHQAGFEVWDVSMTDLLEGRASLDAFRGLAFVGGFSYADVMDSAKGWSGVIRFNTELWEQFNAFYARPDTFSLGICNGCQLMALLGWVPWRDIAPEDQPRFIHNQSGRFESRFTSVTIAPSPAIMLQGMEDAVLGIWVAHGEGRAFFPDDRIRQDILAKDLAPIRYVDDGGTVTTDYPFNPNGSPDGIAGLCSPDGRHLAMMPHPERAFLKWQWGWLPADLQDNLEASPWLRMFQNAREWCEGSIAQQ